MRDETVIIRKAPTSFAYLFWVSGIRRGDHAVLNPEGTTVGRGREADVLIDDPTVSEEQARIRKEGGAWFLYDLASTNMSEVDSARTYRTALQDKARLTFGETEMVFRELV
ncbi:MAG: FHA domain-containing protein [Dehalococcoidia bacterium]|nr:FHA domain-containing protein [Dehalococcoidia bacterium]